MSACEHVAQRGSRRQSRIYFSQVLEDLDDPASAGRGSAGRGSGGRERAGEGSRRKGRKSASPAGVVDRSTSQSSEATVLDNSTLKISPVHPHGVYMHACNMPARLESADGADLQMLPFMACGCLMSLYQPALSFTHRPHYPVAALSALARPACLHAGEADTTLHLLLPGINTRRSHLSASKCGLATDSPWGAGRFACAGAQAWV